MAAFTLHFMCSCQAVAEHFQQSAEFPPIRYRGLRAFAVSELPIAVARRPAATALRLQLRMAVANVHKRPKRRGSQMDAHHFEQMGWLLKKGRDDADVRAVAAALAKYLADDPDGDALQRPPRSTQLRRHFTAKT